MKKSKKLLLTTALLTFVLAGAAGYSYWNANRVASVIQLDVNPSIELHVDRDGDVLEVTALNTEAEKVLAGMKMKGADADTAVNAIIGSLLRHGYIDEVANSILLTVEDENTVRGAKLKEELTEEINAILSATAINASILSQDMKETQIAAQEGISEGKATLVQNIVDANETYKADELADLSVNELNLILSNSKNNVSEVKTTGNATDSAYIGRDAAKAAAFNHAGVKEADVRELDVEMDYEYGTMVYDVEFASGQYEYDYSVDAKTGEVLHSHREYDDDYVAPAVKADSGTSKESETTINSTANKEETTNKTANNSQKTTSSTGSNKKEDTSSTDIGKEKAKAIAFNHAGTKESAVSNLVVKREYDDGKLEYHVDFYVGDKEYEYEISAQTGKILDYDVEREKATPTSGKTNTKKEESTTAAKKEETTTATKKEETTTTAKTEETDIGKEKAKAIALSHAGYSESEVTRLRVERDRDDGRIEYSVEFTANGKEYDYEISGSSGKILDYDVEIEDRD